MTTTATELRELDRRVNDGIEVRLLWSPAHDRVVVAVSDDKTGDAFTVDVAPEERALDVFRHPYGYAAWKNVDTRGGEPVVT